MAYHRRFECAGCGRIYESQQAACGCKMRDLVQMMQEPPHHPKTPGRALQPTVVPRAAFVVQGGPHA